METRAGASSPTRFNYLCFVVAGLALISGVALAADGDKRVSITKQSLKSERANAVEERNEFDALVTTGTRSASGDGKTQSKLEASESSSPNVEFWFYTADVELFNDHDNDGYFHGIDLLFDADSIYRSAEVYAVVYLSYEGGPWNEYAETDNFIVDGATSDDEYVIVTELLSGYPSGSYDILIELFDAYDGSFLAWIGPDETSELAFLPLEDADRDATVSPLPEVIVVHESGGGSTGWLFLLAMALMVVQRATRRGRSA